MSFEHWFAFAAASAVLLAIPGPTILLVISYALGHGRKTAGATVAGVALGDFTAMTASMLGLGAACHVGRDLHRVEVGGAAYLVWLGIQLWRAPVAGADGVDEQAPARERPLRIFFHAYAVTALNPKSIVFFVAFLPQFLDLSQPLLTQMAIFEATFLTLAILNASLYAALATAARSTISKRNIRRIVNRTGGSLLIGAGLLTATMKRASA